MSKRSLRVLWVVVACILPASSFAAVVSGDLTKWHRITIDFEGPPHDEMDVAPNPFLDYRLQVEFTAPVSGTVYAVPGFFDGDGSGVGTGSVWRVRFAPDEAGTWTYRASFRTGTNVAVDLDPLAGSPASFDGETGQFTVAGTDPTAAGFRKYGRLESVGGHYLKFRDGGYWVKLGTDNPENFLGYLGFDNTPYGWHLYTNHVQDWNPGDPDWDSPDTASTTDGRGIIGALNYLAEQYLNSFYFMPMNIGADAMDTYPFASTTIDRRGSAANDNIHYDISKLTQWEIVFDHAQSKELFLHFVLSDSTPASKDELDNSTLGVERKLFYRELVARFGHHNAMQWNICEEYDIGGPLAPAVIKEFGEYIYAIDPYRHPITVHSSGNSYAHALAPFLGDEWFKIMSVQTWQRPDQISPAIEYLRTETTAVGNPIPVMLDESIGMNQMSADEYRKRTFWDALLSGGGFEMFKSYGDWDMHDFRVYEAYFGFARFAREFVEDNLPFWAMEPSDGLVTGEDGIYGGAEVFASVAEIYAIYLPSASPAATLSLAGAGGTYEQRWFNPRTGQFEGATIDVTGGSAISLGLPPSSTDDDWVVLLRNTAIPPARSNGQPGGILPAGTTDTTISLDTDVAAECHYDTFAGTDHGVMPSAFDVTGGTSHSTVVTGLTDGRTYSYYVRCANLDGHANTTDYLISFFVSGPPGSVIGNQAAWHLDEGTGSIAGDSSGQGNHGALINNPQWVAGQVGQGLRFDGSNAYVSIPDSPGLDFGAWPGATVALRVKAERLDHTEDQTLYGQWNSLTESRPFQILITDTNRLQCRTNHEDGDATAPTEFTTDTWAHVTCVWSPSGLDLYVDGVLVASDPSVQPYLHDNSENHTLGVRDKSGDLSQFFQGSLDDIHIFSRDLSPAEVENLYSSTPQPQRSNGQPTGILPEGTTQTTISLDTDVAADCRYDTIPGTDYAAMTSTFDVTGGLSHSSMVFGLADGQDYSYYVRCADTEDNANNGDYVITFSVDLVVPTPPVRSNGQPTGLLPPATTQTTISLDTDVAADCRYDTIPGTDYAAMTSTFDVTGGTAHSALVSGLVDGQAYAYHVRCEDTEGDANDDDFIIGFSVDLLPTPPVRSNGQPTGLLPPATTQTTISLDTDVAADCRYDTIPGTDYAAMTSTFEVTGGTAHSALVSGLVDGQAYAYHVRCEDTEGDANDDDFIIGFSVDLLPTPPVRSNGQPTGLLPPATTQTTISLDTDVAADCRYDTIPGTDYAAMTSTFDVTGGTAHSALVSGLVDGQAYAYHVRCEDTEGDANDDDFIIGFSVDLLPTPPVRSNGQPTGLLPPATTQTTISLDTDVAADCRYDTIPGTDYAAMTSTFDVTGGTAHSALVSGLVDGQAYAYHVRCEDTEGDANDDDFIIGFSVDLLPTPPVRSNGQPTGLLPPATTQTTISLDTDVAADCRYDTIPGTDYAAMTSTFDVTGGTAHSALVSGLVDGQAYAYHVRCEDTEGDANDDDFIIGFSVDLLPTPPVRSNGQPTGLLPPATTQTTISLDTDVAADCRYDTIPGTDYAAMTSTFDVTGGTAHSALVSDLVDGQAYAYHVRCSDTEGDTNDDDFMIGFSVNLVVPTPRFPAPTTHRCRQQSRFLLDTDVAANCRYGAGSV